MNSPYQNRVKRGRLIVVIIRISFASAGFVLLRALVNKLGLDILEVSPLFSSLVAATVFLLGFLLNGVLSDYKESEKLPGEISSALYLLSKEIKAIFLYINYIKEEGLQRGQISSKNMERLNQEIIKSLDMIEGTW